MRYRCTTCQFEFDAPTDEHYNAISAAHVGMTDHEEFELLSEAA